MSAAPGAWEAALRERLKGVELPAAEVTPVVPDRSEYGRSGGGTADRSARHDSYGGGSGASAG